jgi:hypothetical protein
MTILMLTPILGPFGGDQLVVALNAGHSEDGTKIGFYHRWEPQCFRFRKNMETGNGFMAVDYAGIKRS